MSYKTVEVELENGRLRASGSETLPNKAHGLLTILTATPTLNPGSANDALADRVADLAGIGRGEHTDLSTNKAHLDDFGRRSRSSSTPARWWRGSVHATSTT